MTAFVIISAFAIFLLIRLNLKQRKYLKDNPICNHDWKEEYYGDRCTKCNLFYAHGQGPWMPEPELDEDDFCSNCGHDKYDFGDVGCASCCPHLFENN